MFFNRHKKQGKEIGLVARNLLKLQFSEDLLLGDEFKIPNGFFEDPYIRAFLGTFIGHLMNYAIGGANWSQQRKGECFLEAIQIVDPSGEYKRIFLSSGADRVGLEKLINDPSYQRGQNDAVTLVGITYNLLSPDDDDPIILEAKKLAPKLAQITSGIFEEDPSSDLSLAVTELTINKHIKENWL